VTDWQAVRDRQLQFAPEAVELVARTFSNDNYGTPIGYTALVAGSYHWNATSVGDIANNPPPPGAARNRRDRPGK
jgi:hypothetical protein